MKINIELKLLLSVITCISVVGCGTTPYKAPDMKGNAVIDFSSARNISAFIFYANGEDCTDIQSLSNEQDPVFGKASTLMINAKQKVAFNFMWTVQQKVCQLVFSLKPEVDGRYRLVAGLSEEHCHLGLLDQNKNNLPVGPDVEFKQMKYVMGLGIRNTCVPIDSLPMVR